MDYIRIFLFYVVLCILFFVLERLFFLTLQIYSDFHPPSRNQSFFSAVCCDNPQFFATHPMHSFSIRRNPLCIESVGLVEKYPVFKAYGSMKKYKKRLRIGGMGSLFLVLLLLRQRGV